MIDYQQGNLEFVQTDAMVARDIDGAGPSLRPTEMAASGSRLAKGDICLHPFASIASAGAPPAPWIGKGRGGGVEEGVTREECCGVCWGDPVRAGRHAIIENVATLSVHP